MQKGVDQRAAIARVVGSGGAGVNHHAGGLVDDGQVFVLVHDVERDLLRGGAQRRRLGLAEDRDDFAGAYFARGFGGFSCDTNLAVLQQELYAGAADLRHLSHEKQIQAHSFSFFGDRKGARLCGFIHHELRPAGGPTGSRRIKP
jgi:hypothetical protein